MVAPLAEPIAERIMIQADDELQLKPWDVAGNRRAGAALLRGPLAAEELATRTGETWRNAHRRIEDLASKTVLDVSPGTTRRRLVSLAQGEDSRVRSALECLDTRGAPGTLEIGQTVVTASVPSDVLLAFNDVLERQATASPPLWAARARGRDHDWMFVFDDTRRTNSDLMVSALERVGARCESYAVGTVHSVSGLLRQLGAEREALRAAARG